MVEERGIGGIALHVEADVRKVFASAVRAAKANINIKKDCAYAQSFPINQYTRS